MPNTKNLDTSRKEALQGLLSSLGYPGDDPPSDAKLSAEQVRKLSEKINEILGDSNPLQGDQPNQPLNEDGLPIIDISEPVNEGSGTNHSPSSVPEPEFLPLSLLSLGERERQRRERDRILDLLEEEERLQQLQEEEDAAEERKEAIRKRKASAQAELEQMKAARELQKKMGRALVRKIEGLAEDKQEQTHLEPRASSPVAKKSVSFADVLDTEVEGGDRPTPTSQPDWGDVTPGRLRAEKRVPLVSAAETQKYPMKMRIVERCPAATLAFLPHDHTADSDDESSSTPRSENHSSDEEATSLSNGLGNEPLEEEFDYDAAQHHREIALEYHKKRHAIGAEAAKTLVASTLDDHEQQGIHRPSGQPLLSRFRAECMAAAYEKSHDPVFTSIGQSVISASRVKPLQNSVKLGKLENDRLLGGDSGESGSEDENVREFAQMLQTGTPTERTSNVIHGVKPSRFKLARGGETLGMTTFQDNKRGDNARLQSTISNVIERKAPSSSPSQRFPINKPTMRPLVKASEPALSMIIGSPSFPMTAGSPSPSQTLVGHLSLVDSSATQDSMAQTSQQATPPAERPVSRFMTERKK